MANRYFCLFLQTQILKKKNETTEILDNGPADGCGPYNVDIVF